MQKKSNLPQKICSECGLPFAWRKKWERSWPDVKFCSERCKRFSKNKKLVKKHNQFVDFGVKSSKSSPEDTQGA